MTAWLPPPYRNAVGLGDEQPCFQSIVLSSSYMTSATPAPLQIENFGASSPIPGPAGPPGGRPPTPGPGTPATTPPGTVPGAREKARAAEGGSVWPWLFFLGVGAAAGKYAYDRRTSKNRR